NSDWDVASTANWLNGGMASVFNNSDSVTFDSTGAAAYPVVNLVGTLAPASVTVDIKAPASYYFSGSGAISGAAGLIKKGTGTLIVQNANTYQGSTVIHNGRIQIGMPNALPATSDVTVQSPGVLDLSANSDAIAGLNGDGIVDNLAGGDSVLDVGNNNANGNFSGVLQNTFGTLGLTKNGNGTLTLSSSNSYAGPTTVNAGTLVLGHPYALGNGSSPLNTVNGGVLDLNGHSIVAASLAGSGGTITNSGSTGTNTLTVLGTTATTFNGVLGENSSGARVQLVLLGNNELRLGGANTFSGGSFVGSGATLGINYLSTANPAGPSPIVLSNGATLYLHQGSGGSSTYVGNPVSITDNSAATLTSSQLGNGYSGSMTGAPTATNLISRSISLSASNLKQYHNFLGRVVIPAGVECRFSGATINNGGDNTTFEVNGTMHVKGGSYDTATFTVALGALTGTGYIDNPTGTPNQGTGIYLIGAKGVDTVYSGTFSGTNRLVKVGSASLTLDGVVVTTNTDTVTYTNYFYAPAVRHFGTTTISNGVLALTAPNTLSNSPAITLAGAAAVLDASRMGYVSDQLDASLTVTNQVLVTNGVFELYSGQTLAGLGTLQGSLNALAGSTVAPGNGMGKLTVSGSAALGGLVTMKLNRTNAAGASDLLVAQSITTTGNLVVSNAGPDLVNGDSFKLFSVPVSGFATVTLPATTSGGSAYVWDNRLAIDGTIQLVSGGLSPIPSAPTNLTYAMSGSTLTLSWPADYTGWFLQVQTNHLTSGVSTNVLDWGLVSGSADTNRMDLTVDPAQPTRFYRMVHP
ncbi:MAG TPA: autotransporter-associated beta strand repeat-containing protein, partial [Bacillota bacterium]|nr:autotransporter-associated beta strand repeat-containing protein [Bacillota bacterium]